ncbi:VOC family protein [Desulforhopalus singaporensis]|uniref:Catechol 2,3-dioxygenase n=1 Tax=Desulforhopalus singaporensis TaxID=91360 RepID=A0A1H0UJY2_9BACT|nr:VOC family protein [Desulforhopalus singaporensis]SDP66355.1 Catechol 2,3-dioxygenase [Desulforhopalus singaporensis]
MITRPDHVNIVVSDLKQSCDFFSLLGFTKGPGGRLSGVWISEVVGLENVDADYVELTHPGSRMRIELICYRSPVSGKSPDIGKANRIGIRHIAFAVDNIEATVEKLAAAGVRFDSGIQLYPATGKKLVYFKGPDNILLELAEYPLK